VQIGGICFDVIIIRIHSGHALFSSSSNLTSTSTSNGENKRPISTLRFGGTTTLGSVASQPEDSVRRRNRRDEEEEETMDEEEEIETPTDGNLRQGEVVDLDLEAQKKLARGDLFVIHEEDGRFELELERMGRGNTVDEDIRIR
jgi:hypothetical protein